VTVQILVGNCVDTLKTLSENRFHCCVTSPPYWGLRSYGTPDLDWPAISYAPLAGLPECVHVPAMKASLGLEPTLEAFIGHMLLVFREVRRVLRDDGTAWVNMGDSYAGSRGTDAWGPSEKAKQGRTASRRRDDEPIPRSDVRVAGLKPKDLVGQPWRLALALQADGWWLRSDVIWSKRNPMPESTKDRPTKAHEYVFLLSKSERYYYDAKAIKEPASPDTNERYARGRSEEHKHSEREHACPGSGNSRSPRASRTCASPSADGRAGPATTRRSGISRRTKPATAS
jgi:DNA modification methylase